MSALPTHMNDLKNLGTHLDSTLPGCSPTVASDTPPAYFQAKALRERGRYLSPENATSAHLSHSRTTSNWYLYSVPTEDLDFGRRVNIRCYPPIYVL